MRFVDIQKLIRDVEHLQEFTMASQVKGEVASILLDSRMWTRMLVLDRWSHDCHHVGSTDLLSLRWLFETTIVVIESSL